MATPGNAAKGERQPQAAQEEDLLESTALGETTTGHKTSLHDVKLGIYTVMYKMLENSWPASPWSAIFLWCFDLLQMLVLPLSMDANMPWREQSLVSGLHSFLSPVALMPQRDAPHSPAAALYLFIVFSILVALLVALFASAVAAEVGAIMALAASSSRPPPRPRWRFALLRVGTRVLLSGFMVPVFTSMIAPFSCSSGSTWYDSGLTCYSGGHAGLVVAAVLILPVATVYFLLTAACLVNRTQDPAGKKNALAAPHGRVDAAMLVLKIAVAILYAFIPASNPWAPAILSVVISMCWLYLFMTYMPYYNMTLNRVQASLAGVHASAGVAAILSLALPDRSHNAGSYVFFFLLAPAAYAAQALVLFRLHNMSKVGDTTSPYGVELRVRLLLEEAASPAASMAYRGSSGGSGDSYAIAGFGTKAVAAASGLYLDEDDDDDSADGEDEAALRGSSSSDRAGKTAGGRPRSASTARSGHVSGPVVPRAGASVAGSQRSGAASVIGAAASKEERNALIRRFLARGTETTPADYTCFPKQADTSRARRTVNELYMQALDAFSNSAICELFAAHWWGVQSANPHLERIHLSAALAKADSAAVDIHFFVAARRLALKDEEDLRNKNAMTVQRRMELETAMSRVVRLVQSCRQSVLAFWSLLSEKSPDLFRLQTLGTQITEYMDRAHGSFGMLLEMSSESAPVMRAYADFLLEVANDPRKAMDLLTDAEQIEDEQTRAQSQRTELDIVFGRLSSFDISSESLALFRVSAEVENMGTVIEANSAALKLFGYNRRELIGKDISSVVPEPWATVHDMFLARYRDDGKEHIVNSSRIYIALHRAGHVFPMRVNIRPTGNDWSCVAEEIATSQSLVIFTGAEMGWKVTAVCKSAQTGLGVDIQAMRASIVSIRTFLPSVEDTVAHLLLHREGGVVTLRNVVADILGDRAADRDAAPTNSAVVKAKLQVVRSPNIPSPIFIMRFRRATAVERETAGLLKKAAEAAEGSGKGDARRVVMAASSSEDDEEAGSYRSDEAAGSGSEEEEETAGRHPRFQRQPSRPRLTMKPQSGVVGPAPPSPARKPLVMPPSPHDATGLQSTSPNALEQLIAEAIEDMPCPVTGRTGPLPPGHGSAAAGSRDASRPSTGGASASRRDSTGSGAAAGTGAGTMPSTGSSSNMAGPASASSGALRQRRAGATGSASRITPEPVVATTTTTLTAKSSTSGPAASSGRSLKSTSSGRGQGAVAAAAVMAQGTLPIKVPSRRPSRVEEAIAALQPTARSSNALVSPDGRVRTATGDDNRSALGGGEGKRSAVSGGQSSFTSATSATELLRKGVTLRAHTFEPSLLTLRRTILFVFLVATLLNVASLSICLGLLGQLQDNMDLVAQNGQRGVYLQRSYGGVQSLAIMGVLPYNRTQADVLSHLAADLDGFEALHQDLYLHVDGQLASEVHLYTVPSINVTDLVEGSFVSLTNYSSTSRLVNLMNGGLEFISKVRHIANTQNASDIEYSDTDAFWVLQNGYIPLRNAFNQSMLLANDRSAAQADTIALTNLIVLAAAFGVFAVVALGVMVPAVYKVHSSKQSVMDTFLHVPVGVIRALRGVAFAKLAAIRRAAEEEEAGMDLARDADFDGDELVNFGADPEPDAGVGHPPGFHGSVTGPHGPGMPGRSYSVKNFGAASAQLNKAIGDMVARETRASTTDASGATATGTHSRRRFRRAASDRISMLVRMLWPIVVFMSYYVASYFYRENAVDFARYAKSEVLWSKQVQFYSSQLNFNLRLALSHCELDAVLYQHDRASNAIRVINDYVDGLMYGSTQRELRPGLQVSDATFHLFMNDGCVENGGLYYDMQDCQNTFFDRIVAHGLLGAFKVYIQMIDTLLTRRLAALEAGICSPNDLITPDAILAQRLGDEFLAVGFDRAAAIRIQEELDYFVSFRTTDILVTVASLIVLIVYYFAVYGPMLRKLDKEIKQARALLLLFPDEVARSAPAILDAGRAMLRLDGSRQGLS